MMQADHTAASRNIERNGAAPHVLDTVRDELVAAVHEVNNPLAIISGNAQLLVELTRDLDLDAEMRKSIADIEHASMELATRLQRLARLKEDLLEVRSREE